MKITASQAAQNLKSGKDVFMYVLALRGDGEVLKTNVPPVQCGDIRFNHRYPLLASRVFLMGKRGAPIKKGYDVLETYRIGDPDVYVRFYESMDDCILAYNDELESIAVSIEGIRDRYNNIRNQNIGEVRSHKIFN